MTLPVLKDDDGIRPAGPPDACFYCQRKVGQLHQARCVCMVRRTTYRVYDEDGSLLGIWKHYDPDSWTDADCERHKNESSWCAGNLPFMGGYDGDPLPDDECLCGKIRLVVMHRGAKVRRSKG